MENTPGISVVNHCWIMWFLSIWSGYIQKNISCILYHNISSQQMKHFYSLDELNMQITYILLELHSLLTNSRGSSTEARQAELELEWLTSLCLCREQTKHKQPNTQFLITAYNITVDSCLQSPMHGWVLYWGLTSPEHFRMI